MPYLDPEKQTAWYQSNGEKMRAYRRKWTDAHRDEYRSYRKARRHLQQRWFTDNLRLLRETQGCCVCGTHEGSFVHHHLDPETKVAQVSAMYQYGLESLFDEIAKCTVMCLPCHLSLHKRC
jgi:hypothetical protein